MEIIMNKVDMVEVVPLVEHKVIKETLSRVGIVDKKKKVLWPSCYLYEQDSKFYIVHFKQLFKLTRQKYFDNLSDEDVERRNSVIFCLSQWGLIDVVAPSDIDPHEKFVFVLPYNQKKDYLIQHKFNVGYFNK